MGYYKNRAMYQDDHGYSYSGGECVCLDCITDDALRVRLEGRDTVSACSYCGLPQGIRLDDLLDEIGETVLWYYTGPANILPYNGAEGGYLGEVLTGAEMLAELTPWTDSQDLFDAVAEAFEEAGWTSRDAMDLSPYQALSYGWSGFATQVKHRTRFLFLHEHGGEGDDWNAIPPANMLTELGTILLEFGLVTTLPAGTEVVRARVSGHGERFDRAADLGTAPRDAATRPNRMSPAGIPMFYAALDEDTAVLETLNPGGAPGAVISLGRFKTLEPLTLIDLTNLPSPPSMFDVQQRGRIPATVFMSTFEAEFTKPIERDERVHIDYVPTQVVTEFLRHTLTTRNGQRFDGVLYRSSRSRASTAVVLFVEHEECGPRVSSGYSPPPIRLELIDVRHADPSEFA